MRWTAWIAGLALLVSLGSLAVFFERFDPYRSQPAIDGLIVVALISFAAAALLAARLPAWRWRLPAAVDVAIVVAMNATLCALWLPHWDNWRWAYTGDSVAWYGPAWSAAHNGLERSVLSMRGVDFHFTYLHSLGFNALMFVFEPTFFWHRVGKLIVSAMSLTSLWIFFRITVGRWWALAIAICAALNFYLVRMSYVSYGHIDSLFFCFNALTLTTLLWRRDTDRRLWLLAGLNAGLSFYFTQTAWTGVGAAGLLLVALAIRRGRIADLACSAAMVGICAVPIALQWQDFLQLISSQTKPNLEWGYLTQMFAVIFRLPYDAAFLNQRSVDGGFLQSPLGGAYVAGVALSVLALVPIVRRRLRFPPATPLLLALLLLEVLLLTIMNNAYAEPSANRTYHLIPLQIFFACLPFVTLGNLMNTERLPRLAQSFAPALLIVVIGLYAQRNLAILFDPPAFIFGSKTTDGFIELRQRHPDKRALYVAGSSPELVDYQAGSFFDEVYGLAATVRAIESPTASSVQDACAAGSLVCCHTGSPCDVLTRAIGELGASWSFATYPIVNSRQLACYECRPAATARRDLP